MAMTVEDVLGARSRLRERAAWALADRKADEAAAAEDERERLKEDAIYFLRTVLKAEEPELETLHFEKGKQNPTTECVLFWLDDIRFKARYEQVRLMEKNGEFGKETIYAPSLVVEVYANAGWQKIESLADLGHYLG